MTTDTGARRDPEGDERSDRNQLRAAIKARDGWWPALVIGPLANQVVALVRDAPAVTPNRVTAASLLVGLAGAFAIAFGGPSGLVAGALLVQLAFLLDCVDGQLARYRGSSSLFGSLVDRVSDRVKPPITVLAIAVSELGQGSDVAVLLLAFLAAFSHTMIDVYLQAYRRLSANLDRGPGSTPGWIVAASRASRVLDAPFVRMDFGTWTFLVLILVPWGRGEIALAVIAAFSTLQAVLRPFYYLAAFRRDFGFWPWNDVRSHRLGDG